MNKKRKDLHTTQYDTTYAVIFFLLHLKYMEVSTRPERVEIFGRLHLEMSSKVLLHQY